MGATQQPDRVLCAGRQSCSRTQHAPRCCVAPCCCRAGYTAVTPGAHMTRYTLPVVCAAVVALSALPRYLAGHFLPSDMATPVTWRPWIVGCSYGTHTPEQEPIMNSGTTQHTDRTPTGDTGPRDRMVPLTCPFCGYDNRANRAIVCTECGREITEEAFAQLARQHDAMLRRACYGILFLSFIACVTMCLINGGRSGNLDSSSISGVIAGVARDGFLGPFVMAWIGYHITIPVVSAGAILLLHKVERFRVRAVCRLSGCILLSLLWLFYVFAIFQFQRL